MLKELVKGNKFLFKLALDLKERKLKKDSSKLNENELDILKQLEEDGVAVIPNFYSEQQCQNMINDFENMDGKYIKHIENDKRIFGIEKLSDTFKILHHDNQMFKKIGEAYVGDELVLQTTMAAKIISDESAKFGSGGSWHRDSFSRQFKAIAYLDDVSMENGPFMYIKGSHKMENIKKVIDKLDGHTPGDYRYTDEEIEKIKDILDEDITYYTAPKGTLVLADIRGLHTGMPIREGHRYAVFNYYIAKSYHQPNNNVEKLANY